MANSTTKLEQAPESLFNLPDGLTPDSIDILPVLSALLARLADPPSSTSTSSSPPATAPTSTNATSASQLASSTGPISIKDLPAATDELKHKLQKAKVLIRQLPDMDRSVEEQEEEVAELEDLIRRQRETLEGLRAVGETAKREREERLRGIWRAKEEGSHVG